LETARLICSKESGLHQQSLAEALSSWFHEELAEKWPVKIRMAPALAAQG